MRMTFFIGFFMIIIGIGSVFSFFIFNLYGVFKNPCIYKISLSVFVGFPLVFIISYALSAYNYNILNSWVHTLGSIWIGTLLYVFLTAIFLSLCYLFLQPLTLDQLQYIGTSCLIMIFATISYALYNASHPVVVHMKVTSSTLAPLWAGKKIILFSDTHLGLIRKKAFAQKVVDLVNAQNPDLVLMAGDMIDGPIIPYEDFSRPFSTIHSTFGTYYTPGNHEWYNVEPEKFINTMKHFTTALIDQKIEVNGTQIIGINYAQESESATQARLKQTGYTPTKPSIVIMHDPKNNDILTATGVSLVVSGHTHCGQFWPFSILVKRLYKDKTYGVRQLGDQATLTTCGVGTAQAPFRLGNKPEIVVIEIQ